MRRLGHDSAALSTRAAASTTITACIVTVTSADETLAIETDESCVSTTQPSQPAPTPLPQQHPLQLTPAYHVSPGV